MRDGGIGDAVVTEESMPTNVLGVILAGGEGRRFRPFTEVIAKPMIPIGPLEKPILEYIIAWLSYSGVRKLVLLVGYRGRQIQNYFRDGSHWNVEIMYSSDEPPYSNTGGALLNAYRRGLLDEYEDLIIWYGDILAEVDVRALLYFHRREQASATLVVADKYKLPVGVVKLDKDFDVIELVEKPWYPINVTIGVLALKTNVLERVEAILGTSFDIMGDLIPMLIRRSRKVKAFIYGGPWYDVGSLERYEKLDLTVFNDLTRIVEENEYGRP